MICNLLKKKRIRSDYNYDNIFLQSNNNSKNDVKKKKRGKKEKKIIKGSHMIKDLQITLSKK